MTRLQRVRKTTDRGFTLVELLVVLMLVAIVGSIVMSVTITSFKTAAKQENQTRTLTAGKVALERMTREIRNANSMVVADAQEIVFVTRAEGVRQQTRIHVRSSAGGTDLVQTDVRTDIATNADLGTTERVVLGGLAMGRSEALFRYYAGSYNGEGQAGTVELGPGLPGDVRTVGVRVRLLRDFGAAPIELYQVVSVRNLED